MVKKKPSLSIKSTVNREIRLAKINESTARTRSYPTIIIIIRFKQLLKSHLFRIAFWHFVSVAGQFVSRALQVRIFICICLYDILYVLQWRRGWLAAAMDVKDDWKSTTAVAGELFVTTISTTSTQESHATVSASGENIIARCSAALSTTLIWCKCAGCMHETNAWRRSLEFFFSWTPHNLYCCNFFALL